MEPTKQQQKTNPIFILGSLTTAMVLVTCIFVFLFQSEVKTMQLLRNEYAILGQQKRIIDEASTISVQYKDEINVISEVFPNEQTIPIFIQTLEGLIKQSANEYTFRFNSLNPIIEGDKLFLLLTITMKTDLPKLLFFLSSLERLPYMTHVTGLIVKTPSGFTGNNEASIGMKIYVQNPFTTIK